MRSSTIVMIGFAVVFGLLAVFLAQGWLNSQAEMRARSLDAQKKPLATQTMVVAGKPLRYGDELTAQSLREIPWPDAPLPEGAFAKIDDMLKDGKRIVLTADRAERGRCSRSRSPDRASARRCRRSSVPA